MLVKRLVAALLAVATAAAAAGCGKGSENNSGDVGSDKVTLNFWCFNSFAQENSADKPGTFEQSLIDEYTSSHPGVEINLTLIDFTTGPEKLETAIENDIAPDILFDAPGRIIAYGKRGELVALDELFDEEFVNDVGNDSLLSACRAGDTYYMYPISSAPFYMAFNLDYLENAGARELVKEGWTTDDFTKTAELLAKAGYAPPSVFCKDQSGDQGTRAFIANLYSSGVMNDTLTEYTIGSENGKKAFRYLYDISQKGYILNGKNKTAADALNDFAAGAVSYTLLWGPSQQKQYSELLLRNGINVLEVPFPSDDGEAELEYLINGFCVFDNGDNERASAAKDFVKFAGEGDAGERAVRQTGCIPARQSMMNIYEGDEEIIKLSGWTRYYGPYYNTVDGFADMRKKWYIDLRAMLSGNVEPETAAEEFAGYANGLLSSRSSRTG